MDLKKIVILAGVGLASAAVGILLPNVISNGHGGDTATHAAAAPTDDSHAADKEKTDHEPKKDAGGHGGHADAGKDEGKEKPKEGPQFLPFARMVVNLNEPMLVKFLSIEISVQTDAKYESEVKAALEARKPILTTWLTSHLADKTMEEIRGKVGVNRLRREIQDNFNSLLFKDGHERVQDIMFEEFHVQ
jgi:flagellar FliL protein